MTDLFAAEYGWTLDYVRRLTITDANALVTRITHRRQSQIDAVGSAQGRRRG